ncbi:hypothetical protein P0092_09150 [Ruminiclostridium papyrosolvens DSM 2782]|uniref:hypothetical protein n=1 Tax=Ruminiclostridium papyrosolvens TaxID=29362 RepID=UPI00130EC75B|nr:hypothetical protein [Ruminiclostridium papyrosolvens]WES36014.1 hypothetical protein P0092_08650 [Ruminiclostridium papyrosolvens DSM 2782]WES36112.1 hypothetical protein P0092_09150 [Ruminiclostridium papyrosolvens DSM 2782]
MKCPYYENSCDKLKKINCKRGTERTNFQGKGYDNQLKSYCDNTYNKCWCYQHLEGLW